MPSMKVIDITKYQKALQKGEKVLISLNDGRRIRIKDFLKKLPVAMRENITVAIGLNI